MQEPRCGGCYSAADDDLRDYDPDKYPGSTLTAALDALPTAGRLWEIQLWHSWLSYGPDVCYLDVWPSRSTSLDVINFSSIPLWSMEEEPYFPRAFLAIVRIIAELTQPLYGWAGSNYHLFDTEVLLPEVSSLEELARRPLEWWTYLGRDRVESIGRERLGNTPSHQVEWYVNGGISVLLSPHPDLVTVESAQAVADHLGLLLIDPPNAVHFGGIPPSRSWSASDLPETSG